MAEMTEVVNKDFITVRAHFQRAPASKVASAELDARTHEAWCQWLSALATDAEAALAAAIAYNDLDPSARDSWLSALEQDVSRVDAPKYALYAPLLSVESDPARRERMTRAVGAADAARATTEAYALAGGRSRLRVAIVVMPLYLDFVQVLACGFQRATGFEWVRHEPILHASTAPRAGSKVESLAVESMPLQTIVDELAHAVLAHQRQGRPPPDALRAFADLFDPRCVYAGCP
jgi:hypothetical protein